MAHQSKALRKRRAFFFAAGDGKALPFLVRHPLRGGFVRRLRLALSSRGPVAKNAPQERFLNAPADDAPEIASRVQNTLLAILLSGHWLQCENED